MTTNQRTLRTEATIEGLGLFSGRPATVVFKPAPVDHGVVLYRMELLAGGEPARIPALVEHVVHSARRTALRSGEAAIETCEHVLSAVAGVGVDNLRIEVSGPEIPMADGSALPFVRTLESAGLQEQDGPRRVLTITEPLTVGTDEIMIQAMPSDDNALTVSYDLDYGPTAPIPPQIVTYELGSTTYVADIAPARTFVLEHELQSLQRQGLCAHLTPRELLVIGPNGPVAGRGYRFPDEPARHKVLDIIGDLLLLGRPLRGRIRAYRSGHALNQVLVRELARTLAGAGA